MKRRHLLAAAVLVACAVPALAAPGDMSAAAFLAKADALKARGAMALFSSDIGVLKAEGMAASNAYRERLRAERAAGRPSSCPQQGTRINSEQILAHLRTYPDEARTRTSMKTAMADYFIRTYPCR